MKARSQLYPAPVTLGDCDRCIPYGEANCRSDWIFGFLLEKTVAIADRCYGTTRERDRRPISSNY